MILYLNRRNGELTCETCLVDALGRNELRLEVLAGKYGRIDPARVSDALHCGECDELLIVDASHKTLNRLQKTKPCDFIALY